MAAVWVWAATQLWDTIVPGGLELPEEQAARSFDAAAREEGRSFETLNHVLFLLSQLTLIVVLALYVKRGPGLMKESAAGPIGTGFLLGIMGIALVWLVQVPFALIETWWARRHDASEVGYVEVVFGGFFGLAGEAVFLCLLLLIVMAFARWLRAAWWLPGVAVPSPPETPSAGMARKRRKSVFQRFCRCGPSISMSTG